MLAGHTRSVTFRSCPGSNDISSLKMAIEEKFIDYVDLEGKQYFLQEKLKFRKQYE